jgi:hypothetical protein
MAAPDRLRGYDGLPGGELVVEGLRDLERGLETGPALLVSMAAPRLRQVGVEVPESAGAERPSHRLYDLLASQEPDSAHSHYNALVRRIVSFARAAEHAHQR